MPPRKHKIQQRRQKLDGAKQADFDLAPDSPNRGPNSIKSTASGSRSEKAPGEPVVVESYPTPISRAVDGPEAHLLISNGRVMFIPLERILEEFQSQAKRQAYKLADQDGVDRDGRADGRIPAPLHARASRHSRPDGRKPAAAAATRGCKNGRSFPPRTIWASRCGWPWQKGSDFRRTLAKILPGRTTITIWVYPDGFDAFRQIRKELYRLNYAIAARPLPPGTPISGSPEGSKSAAQ